MKKASLFIIIVSLLSKVLGFVRETVLAATYGAGNISDAFIFAYGLPGTLFSVIAAAFVTGFIPMYSRVEADDGEEAAGRFMNNILHVMLIFSILVVSIFLLIPEPIIGFLLPNATPELLEFVLPFTQITVFSILMTSLIQLMTGFLHLKDYFVFPMLMGFPMNIVVIFTIMVSRRIGTHVLPIGILVSYILQASLIVGFSMRKGYRYKPTLDFKDPDLRRMLYLAIPLIIGSSTGTIGDMINKAIVSGVEGGVSYINYSTKLGSILQSVFGTAITSVAYPSLARSIARNDMEETYKSFGDAVISICLLIAPAALGLIVLARPIVQVVYMRGEFTQADLDITVPVFLGYSVGLIFISLRDLFTRMFYSFQNTKIPMWNSIIMASIQGVLAIVLFRTIGIHGVTWAMSIATIVGLINLGLRLRKQLVGFPIRRYFNQAIRILIASVVMAIVSLTLFNVLSSGGLMTLLALAAAIMTGIITYLVLVIVLRVEPVISLIHSVKAKLR